MWACVLLLSVRNHVLPDLQGGEYRGYVVADGKLIFIYTYLVSYSVCSIESFYVEYGDG